MHDISYQPIEGRSECRICEMGTSSVAGSTSCDMCSVGYMRSLSGKCIQCDELDGVICSLNTTMPTLELKDHFWRHSLLTITI